MQVLVSSGDFLLELCPALEWASDCPIGLRIPECVRVPSPLHWRNWRKSELVRRGTAPDPVGYNPKLLSQLVTLL